MSLSPISGLLYLFFLKIVHFLSLQMEYAFYFLWIHKIFTSLHSVSMSIFTQPSKFFRNGVLVIKPKSHFLNFQNFNPTCLGTCDTSKTKTTLIWDDLSSAPRGRNLMISDGSIVYYCWPHSGFLSWSTYQAIEVALLQCLPLCSLCSLCFPRVLLLTLDNK